MRRNRFPAISLVSVLLMSGLLVPVAAHAGIMADIIGFLTNPHTEKQMPATAHLQTIPLLKAAMNINPAPATGGGDVTIVDDSALVPSEGPSGTIADIERPKTGTISKYVVRNGDTLSSIAKMFQVTPQTVLWANDLTKTSVIHEGEVLTILPVTGLNYTIKSGDTLKSLATKYSADATEIATFNGIDPAADLAVGDSIIIPDGELSAPAAQPTTSSSKQKHVIVRRGMKFGPEPAHDVGPDGSPVEVAYFIAPLDSYTRTQGIHGYNAVDLGAPIGTPILAAATGDVIVAKQGGWNGGYGSYIVIEHPNGAQTLYGHASRVIVGDGEHVIQGQIIGYVGSTGKSTGSHVHFEIRNGIKNPF